MRSFLHHFFFPHESNGHRAKIIHHDSILITLSLLIFTFSLLTPIQNTFPAVLGITSSITPIELLHVTNKYRQEYGLQPLQLSSQLSGAASAKASDMLTRNYWAHISPDGVTPWVFIKNSGYEYLYAGENLARGFNNAQEVVSAWMDSPTHRDNMLSPNYSDVGFAIATGSLSGSETILVVEMFGTKYTELEQEGSTKETPIVIAQLITVTPTPANSDNTPGTVLPETINTPAAPTQQNLAVAAASQQPLINTDNFSRNLILGFLVLFIGVLLADAVFVERKKIVRAITHNADHMFFLIMITLAIMVIGRGNVL